MIRCLARRLLSHTTNEYPIRLHEIATEQSKRPPKHLYLHSIPLLSCPRPVLSLHAANQYNHLWISRRGRQSQSCRPRSQHYTRFHPGQRPQMRAASSQSKSMPRSALPSRLRPSQPPPTLWSPLSPRLRKSANLLVCSSGQITRMSDLCPKI